MGLFFKSTVLDDYKKNFFNLDEKLYSKYLKKCGVEPENGKNYTNLDVYNYLKRDYDIRFDESKKELSIGFGGIFQILDKRSDKIIFEHELYEVIDEEFEKIHQKCLDENLEITYMSENLNDPTDMVYPYTHVCIGKSHCFDIDKVQITISKDSITFSGPTTYTVLKDMDVTIEEGYSIQKKLEEEKTNLKITIPLIFTNGNKKELSKILQKSKLFRKDQISKEEL